MIRYVKASSTSLGAGSKVRTTTGLIAATDKGGLQVFAYPLNVEFPL